MKTALVAVLTLAVSFGANANVNNVQFKALDETVETQVCVAAAQEGISGAKAIASALGADFSELKRRVVCNDQSLSRFAAKYTAQPKAAEKDVVFKFVAVDNAPASQICKEAVENGFAATESKYKNIDNIYCNGLLIERFARKHKA
ncbi:hypothetical protein ACFSJY_00510 [Thalassotalea euphylliae]|uniref:hypothetical protein n=1 Tax=Thalassotalea euphylliae TaxID=1655234 RepID=UPI00363B938C